MNDGPSERRRLMGLGIVLGEDIKGDWLDAGAGA